MPVPSTQDIRRALLEILEEHPQSMTLKEWMSLAEKYLGVTVSINTQESKDFRDRIRESLQYLTDENMISNPSKALYMITKKGKNMLKDKTENIDKELDTLPEELDLTHNEPEAAEKLDIADEKSDALPELDALHDELDMTSDDALDEEIHDPESSEAASEDLGSQPSQQDTQINTDIDTENSLDSDTDTLNSIDEVDPDMPKDDLPADDFSTTEDFSGAVNQALNIEDVFERHNSELADKILMRAAGLSQEMFAVFVTDLLSKMGYNAFQTARYTSESEGNSLIQGVILDPKAKNPIYIHADKLSPGKTVGRSDMHDFANELAEKGGTGIFATTGEFSEQAGIYAQDERIMLIDGKKLAGLMLANNFCVNVAKVFEVKELDENSFSEYE